jgi:predicted nucleotidyltransferase
MQTKPSPLLPILRSRALASLLAYLFIEEPEETISGIAQRIRVSPSTVKRDIDELEESGIVTTRRSGRGRLVTVNRRSPFYPELRALMLKAFGPVPVLRAALAGVAGIEEAYVFGSWARRAGGERGHAPRDVDVLIVGDVDPDDVYRACTEAERMIRRDVNPTIVTRHEWDSPDSVLLENIKAQPLARIALDSE